MCDAHTPSGYPLIDWVKPKQLMSLVGGNGYAGKSADELGFIAAQLFTQGTWTYDLPAQLFFAPSPQPLVNRA